MDVVEKQNKISYFVENIFYIEYYVIINIRQEQIKLD